MSKDKFIAEVEASFANGKPLVTHTPDYAYAMVPLAADGSKWKELVLMKDDEHLDEAEKEPHTAFLMICEEIEKGLPGYVQDFRVVDFRNFKEGLEGKSDAEKIQAIIEELGSNGAKYSENLPVVTTKEGLSAI